MEMNSYGYLKLVIHDAVMPNLPRGKCYVEIVISNLSIAQRTGVKFHKYIRSTDTISPSNHMSWEDAMELRCCAGWDVQLYVYITDAQGRHFRYDVDRMIVGSSNSGEYPFRQNNQNACGCLRVTLDYFPNYQSMATLSVDCFQNTQLPSLLLTELYSLTQQSEISSHISAPYLAHAVQQFHAIQSEKTLETYLVEKHMPHDAVSSPNSTSSCEFSTIATYRISTIAHSFILSLVHSTIETITPYPDITLLETQLTIFLSALKRHLLPTPKIPSIFDSTPVVTTALHPFGPYLMKPGDDMPWPLALHFIRIAALWYLQHSYIALSMMTHLNIQPSEVQALRKCFEKYDEELSGEISVEDLSYLLEDMGGTYSESEVDLIANMIDPDELNFIEFAEFVHWWTTDNPRE